MKPVPHRCPMGRRRVRAGAPAGHGVTSVGPTVDSYGPPTPESSQACMVLVIFDDFKHFDCHLYHCFSRKSYKFDTHGISTSTSRLGKFPFVFSTELAANVNATLRTLSETWENISGTYNWPSQNLTEYLNVRLIPPGRHNAKAAEFLKVKIFWIRLSHRECGHRRHATLQTSMMISTTTGSWIRSRFRRDRIQLPGVVESCMTKVKRLSTLSMGQTYNHSGALIFLEAYLKVKYFWDYFRGV